MVGAMDNQHFQQDIRPRNSVAIASRYTCPAQLEPLTQTLLRDLPAYINRLQQRNRLVRSSTRVSAVLASQPDFMPLPVSSSEYDNPQDDSLRQVFFTVLERQYTPDQKIAEFQNYHWLFLTQTTQGWQLSLMFSRLGTFPASQQPLTPIRDSSRSITAQAIRTWLRDCQAGAIKPL